MILLLRSTISYYTNSKSGIRAIRSSIKKKKDIVEASKLLIAMKLQGGNLTICTRFRLHPLDAAQINNIDKFL